MRRAAILALMIVLAQVVPASGQDIREAARKARQDRQSARIEAGLAEQRILADRDSLTAAVTRMEQRQADLEAERAGLEQREKAGRDRRQDLEERWGKRELGLNEISGNVRVAARDLESVLKASPLSAGHPERLEAVRGLLREGYFPDLDDITTMAGIYLDEMIRSGQVSLRDANFVGRDGRETAGRVLQVGRFTSVYTTGGETAFLDWSPDKEQLFALAALPSRGVRGKLNDYLAGGTDLVPVDISGGSVLRQLTVKAGLLDQLRAGGPVVYPILLIALAALVIVISRIVFLRRAHGNTDRIMGQVGGMAEAGDWDGCRDIVARHSGRGWPVIHVIRAGLEARKENRDVLETVLQEAILHELPRIQKGVSILAVLGAVAPLLGLLGTVTGMIDTFRVITLFGTSDPRLMSGGISEALTTTELGLAVAIPIMLLHAYISRRADHLIGEMEEKAVQLTNIIQKRQALTEVRR
ncbi:biopolymer transporter ExbB [bacterium CG17_big_fil_post_rev_8_21_14_2_50_64_8]|nr:MAG: biopolymer transporter ExbB [bacterium CG17_big_fil_post_rev_8_21_14_2_50_64_8]PJA76720.1 MAG: biopolymer transporter ExbB [bacterium CG_4_9_14_3_um_filter_65_15]